MDSKTRLLTPGPTPLPENVRLALAQDMIHHRKPAFKRHMHRVQTGLRELFGTNSPVLPLTCSGTGAMEAAVANLFAPGEKVLVVEGGKFGQRWTKIAEAHGLTVERVEVPWGTSVDPAAVVERIAEHGPFRGVLVQASETSTGVLHPIKALAAALQDSAETLLVVDGISAVGVSPCPMESWGIDCLLTGSQKGLMLPPGMALLSLSERAWQRVEDHPRPPFYFNLRAERERNQADQTLFTSPVAHILGLEACLETLLEAGLDSLYRSQWALTQMARAGAEAMGLPPLVPEHYTWGLTSIRVPDDLDGQDVLALAASEYGVIMAGGQEHLKGRIIRLGHMGYVDWGDVLAGLSALGRSCQRLGATIDLQAGLAAALAAYEHEWRTFRLPPSSAPYTTT